MKIKDLFRFLAAAPVCLIDGEGDSVDRIDEDEFNRLLSEYGEYSVIFIQPDIEVETDYDYDDNLIEVSKTSLYTIAIYK